MKNSKGLLIPLAFLLFFAMGTLLMSSLQSALRNTTMTLGVDLYPRWVGSQAALMGHSPYSLETRRQIWNAIYGSPETPRGNPFGFYYPPAIVTLLAPFILIGLSLRIAAVLWCALIFSLWGFFLMAYAMFINKLLRNIAIMALFLLSGLFFRPAFSNYLLGQYALFCVMAFIAAWIAVTNKHEIVGGVLIALALIKFSILTLPVALLIFFQIRNPRTLLAFLSTMVLLYLPPTLLLGWWPSDFIRDISRYATENLVSWSINDVAAWPGIPWLFLSVALTILGLYNNDRELALASCMTLNGLFAPHTADYDLVIFIGLLLWLGYHWLGKQKNRFLKILFFLLLWFPWMSLIAFLYIHIGIESWYRFIWVAYPSLLLLATVSEALRYRTGPSSSLLELHMPPIE
jgi:hypothetical protein